jgi:hypothetical protein
VSPLWNKVTPVIQYEIQFVTSAQKWNHLLRPKATPGIPLSDFLCILQVIKYKKIVIKRIRINGPMTDLRCNKNQTRAGRRKKLCKTQNFQYSNVLVSRSNKELELRTRSFFVFSDFLFYF